MLGILFLVLAAILASNVAAATRAEPETQPSPSLPAVGARVRVLAPALGAGWHTGMFNRLRVEPPCYRIILFASGPTRSVRATLSVRDLMALQVSTIYDGRTRFEPAEPSEEAYAGETWSEVPLELLRAAERHCRVSEKAAPSEKSRGP